jgi:L-asparaginase II
LYRRAWRHARRVAARGVAASVTTRRVFPSPQAEPPAPAAANPVLAVVTRSGAVESWHRGAVAVVHGGELALSVGDVARPVFARSVVKPLQALPFLERGLHERLGLPDAELAVMCASHDGGDVHTAAVRALLARGGFDEGHLRCGPHAPFDADTRAALARANTKPGRLHNNCSGKHAGFLHLARACGDDPERYLDPTSAAQREVAAAVAAMAGVPQPIPVGVDGCGAPTFLLPLAALARAFCALANPGHTSPVRAAACRRILAAAGAAPALLAGERRLCTALLRQWPGRVFAKNGAEGLTAVALAPAPARRRFPGALGLAVKVDDGDERGYRGVVVDLLQALGALPHELPAALATFHRAELRNTQQLVVGEVRPAVTWPLP